VERSIRNVNVINAFLIATPLTNGRLVHPLLTPEFEGQTYERLEKNRRRINAIALLYMLLLPVILLSFGVTGGAIAMALSCLSIYATGVYESRYIYSSRERLKEKVTYYSECLFTHRRIIVYVLVAFFGMALVQIIAVERLGGTDPVMERFAAVLVPIKDGQYLRLLTGQFLHSGISHWASNLITFAWFALLCAPVLGNYVFVVAVLASTAAYCSLAILSSVITLPYDGAIGFSSGVAGLAGYLIGASIASHPALPRMLYVSILPAVFVTFVYFALVTNTSWLLHFLGLFIGGVLGLTATAYKHGRR
jgi:membrane associated rhomboid family serine protease